MSDILDEIQEMMKKFEGCGPPLECHTTPTGWAAIAAAEALLSSMPTGTDAIREWHERRKDWLFYRKAIVGEIE